MPALIAPSILSADFAHMADDCAHALSPQGAAADWLDPGVPEGGIVLTVDGDSMLPRFRHGERLIFGRRHDDPSPLVGHEVMARLADGRKMVKILRRGAAPGLWTLESINTRYPPLEDVELLWALPFEGLRV
jgi:phage repressor protein C with HTH and peptisase S24 domain